MNRAEQAEFYIWALDYGLVEVSEVIEWADSIILEDPSPDLAFINLSLAGSKKKYEAVRALAEVPGEVNQETIFRKKISTLYEVINKDKERASWVTHTLYRMMQNGDVPDEEAMDKIYIFDTRYEYVSSDDAELYKELVSFLRHYSSEI